MNNLFDAVATTAKTTTKKSSKIAAQVNDVVKKAVDLVIKHKAEIKRLKAEQEEYEGTIIDHVYPQQETSAREGKYSKSFMVDGVKGNLTYTTSDKFSVPKEPEVHEEIKKLLGQKKFDELFETQRTITLKEEVQNDSKFIQKMAKVIADAGMTLGDAFEVTDKLIAKSGLDEKQFELPVSKLITLRTLIKQNKAALK